MHLELATYITATGRFSLLFPHGCKLGKGFKPRCFQNSCPSASSLASGATNPHVGVSGICGHGIFVQHRVAILHLHYQEVVRSMVHVFPCSMGFIHRRYLASQHNRTASAPAGMAAVMLGEPLGIWFDGFPGMRYNHLGVSSNGGISLGLNIIDINMSIRKVRFDLPLPVSSLFWAILQVWFWMCSFGKRHY